MKLLRVGNLAFLAILLYVMEKWVAVPLLHLEKFPEQMPWWILTLLILSVVCIAAGGYVINDYFDVKIDRINRPDDMVVTRVISREAAMNWFYVLTAIGVVAGLAVAWWARSWTLAMIYIVIPGLLWFYSASYKRQLLVGNIVGCWLVSLIAKVDTAVGVQAAAEGVLRSRMELGWWACGVKAIGFGILMSTAVQFARKGKEFGHWVPLLFAVPLFIHCGFPHCVADAFYFLACPGSALAECGWELLGVYVSIVIGNSVGCNIYRCILPSENYE